MGDFVLDSNESQFQNEYSRYSKIASMVLILLGILSPVLVTSYGFAGNYTLSVYSLLWTYQTSNWGTYFIFSPLFLVSMFPFLILRLVPSAQIVRYYQEKTTRRRAYFGVMVGDIFFVVGGLIMLFFNFLSPIPFFFIPLPFQMLVGLFILWNFPIPEPTTPWDSSLEAKPWWEQKEEKNQESQTSDEDKDRLW